MLIPPVVQNRCAAARVSRLSMPRAPRTTLFTPAPLGEVGTLAPSCRQLIYRLYSGRKDGQPGAMLSPKITSFSISVERRLDDSRCRQNDERTTIYAARDFCVFPGLYRLACHQQSDDWYD